MILNLAEATERLFLWQRYFSEFDFNFVYLTDFTHQAENAQYQLLTDCTDNTPLEGEIPALENASGEKVDDATVLIIVLEPHNSTSPVLTV